MSKELPTRKYLRCGNTWIPRIENSKQCPKCKSPYWNKPRRKGAQMKKTKARRRNVLMRTRV